MVAPRVARPKHLAEKERGRPATGLGIQIGTRWSDEIVQLIDQWCEKQPDEPGRAKAIRRLVEIGLAAKAPAKAGRKPGRRLRARELALQPVLEHLQRHGAVVLGRFRDRPIVAFLDPGLVSRGAVARQGQPHQATARLEQPTIIAIAESASSICAAARWRRQ
jgi:hypothetical protein